MARRRPDPKEEALRDARALNPRPEAVADEEFAASEFFDARDLVQVSYEMVRRVRVEGDTVSAAAASFGFSRPSWYAAAAALDEDGLPGLLRARPGPRRAHKLSDGDRRRSARPLSRPTRPCGRRVGRTGRGILWVVGSIPGRSSGPWSAHERPKSR